MCTVYYQSPRCSIKQRFYATIFLITAIALGFATSIWMIFDGMGTEMFIFEMLGGIYIAVVSPLLGLIGPYEIMEHHVKFDGFGITVYRRHLSPFTACDKLRVKYRIPWNEIAAYRIEGRRGEKTGVSIFLKRVPSDEYIVFSVRLDEKSIRSVFRKRGLAEKKPETV